MNNTQVMKEIEGKLGGVPEFFKSLEAVPGVLEPVWETFKAIKAMDRAIPIKYEKLIGIAVGAAIPSELTVIYHTHTAKMHEITEREIKEASLVAGHTAGWSSYLHGRKIDLCDFQRQVDEIMSHMCMNTGKAAMPSTGTADQQLRAIMGQVPLMFEEIKKLNGLIEHDFMFFKQVEINEGAIPGKYRELIALAVASAIHCQYCIYFHTEAAKLMGATDRELNEASYYAKLNLLWGTYMRGINYTTDMLNKDLRAVGELMKGKVVAR